MTNYRKYKKKDSPLKNAKHLFKKNIFGPFPLDIKNFDEKNLIYQSIFDTFFNNGTKKFYSFLKRKAKKHFGDNSKILDSGCGVGKVSLDLSNLFKNSNIIGIDKSKKIIETAKINKKKNINFIHMDATETFFLDNYFDFIISCNVIDRVKDPKKYVLEMKRILKKGGKLIISNPLDFKKSKRISERELRNLFEREGFRIIEKDAEKLEIKNSLEKNFQIYNEKVFVFRN